MTATQPILNGASYNRGDGRFTSVDSVALQPSTVLPAGQTLGPVLELGERRTLRLELLVTAKSGTAPTLDCTLLHSADGLTGWRSLGTFAQKTGSGTGWTMGAVTPAGTSPPALTLSGTVTEEVAALRVECTSIGGGAALGSWAGRYSIDGGVTFTAFTSAATVPVLDRQGNPTGLVLNFAAGNASVDNVWTAGAINRERKTFTGCDRYVMPVFNVGGSASPTVTTQILGEV